MFNEYLDYDTKSEKDNEMESKGFKFITNFRKEKDDIYRNSAEIHNVNYLIEIDTYNSSGKLIDNGSFMKAFYVESSIYDLSDFWDTFERLEKEIIK